MVLVLVASWLFPVITILIKLDSKGRVFFIQDRVGIKNRKFKCIKFRTLKETKMFPEKFSPVVENDPRITRIGRFLRTSNLDEFPQFINVLKGNMSIVGPRPHAIQYDKEYGHTVEEIKLRHTVKPGITGWAQIHGLRGDVSDRKENISRTAKRIEYDLWYIENWSFGLDIKIIFSTIWLTITGRTKAIIN